MHEFSPRADPNQLTRNRHAPLHLVCHSPLYLTRYTHQMKCGTLHQTRAVTARVDGNPTSHAAGSNRRLHGDGAASHGCWSAPLPPNSCWLMVMKPCFFTVDMRFGWDALGGGMASHSQRRQQTASRSRARVPAAPVGTGRADTPIIKAAQSCSASSDGSALILTADMCGRCRLVLRLTIQHASS